MDELLLLLAARKNIEKISGNKDEDKNDGEGIDLLTLSILSLFFVAIYKIALLISLEFNFSFFSDFYEIGKWIMPIGILIGSILSIICLKDLSKNMTEYYSYIFLTFLIYIFYSWENYGSNRSNTHWHWSIGVVWLVLLCVAITWITVSSLSQDYDYEPQITYAKEIGGLDKELELGLITKDEYKEVKAIWDKYLEETTKEDDIDE